MRLPTFSILAILLAPGALSAQGTLYSDPQNRFTIHVPEDWTAQDLGDRGALMSGSGLSIRITPLAGLASLQEAVASLVGRLSPGTDPLSIHGEGLGVRYGNLQEIDRQQIPIVGQPASWIIFQGTDSAGKPGMIRVMAVQGGGATVGVIISGERSTYAAQRGTIEAILFTLRLGTNPPSAFKTYAANRRDSVGPDSESPPPASASNQAGIGLEVRDVTEDDVQELDLSEEAGALVEQVEPGGPAEAAGIQEGDVILQVDRTRVARAADLERMLAAHRAGDTVVLLVTRNGREKTVSMRLAAGQ